MSVFITPAHSIFLRKNPSSVLRLGLWGLGLGLGLGLAACSKGGMPDQPSCNRLMDQPGTKEEPLPKALYAELRTAATGVDGATIGVTLSGSGGIYSGMYAFNKCDAPGTYYAERLVLLSATGNSVATAVRVPLNNSYAVTYLNGNSTTATGSFTNSINYSITGATRPINVAGLSPAQNSARQGER